MKLKASLHIHTKEDKRDGHMIGYDVYRLIDEAKAKGFRVLGFTPHQKFVFKEEYGAYAAKQGILLIPGVERSFGRVLNKHVVILNCDKTIEQVRNFKQLIAYKQTHPEIFVLAPHPTYSRVVSMGARNLRKYIGLFDAIEHSWLYTLRLNGNRKAEAIAREFGKPVVATADLHWLNNLDTDYTYISAEEQSTESVLDALREGRVENVSSPKILSQLVTYLVKMYFRYVYAYIAMQYRLHRLQAVKATVNES